MKQYDEKIDGSLALPFDRMNQFIYLFGLDDTDLVYEVGFEQDGDMVEVGFTAESKDMDFTHDQIDIGIKSTVKVFHTVWEIIKDFLETSEDPIDALEFSAKKAEPSRVKFYRTLAGEIAEYAGFKKSDVEEIPEMNGVKDSMFFIVPIGIE